MMLSSVDFPQPLGPTRQTNSPSPTSSETSSSAWTVRFREWRVGEPLETLHV